LRAHQAPEQARRVCLVVALACSPFLQERAISALDPKQKYTVTFRDEQRRVTSKTLTGAELAAPELRIEKTKSSLLVRYAPDGGARAQTELEHTR
jgi:hypothetical protein